MRTRVPPHGSAAYVLDAPSLPPLLQICLPELASGVLAELNLSRIGEQTSFPVVSAPISASASAAASPARRGSATGERSRKARGGGGSASGSGGGSASGGGGGGGREVDGRESDEGSQSQEESDGEGSELRVYCLVDAEGPTKVLRVPAWQPAHLTLLTRLPYQVLTYLSISIYQVLTFSESPLLAAEVALVEKQAGTT